MSHRQDIPHGSWPSPSMLCAVPQTSEWLWDRTMPWHRLGSTRNPPGPVPTALPPHRVGRLFLVLDTDQLCMMIQGTGRHPKA